MTSGSSSSAGGRIRYDLVADSSAVLIQARSNVGPVELASTTISGLVEATLADGRLDTDNLPVASLELPVTSLRSGNSLYDNEIHRRLDAARYPRITATLTQAKLTGPTSMSIGGELTIHGESREMSGSAELLRLDADVVEAVGEQSIDIRDFSISLPSALMLRIYPDVIVRFRLHGTRAAQDAQTG